MAYLQPKEAETLTGSHWVWQTQLFLVNSVPIAGLFWQDDSGSEEYEEH